MTDPPRLLQKPSSGLAGTLLAAGRDETPGEAALRRTLTAVGVGAAVLTSSSVAGGTLASGAAGTAVAKGSAGSAGFALALKWIGIGTLGGVVTATAAYELAPSPKQADSVQAPAIVASAVPPKRPARSADLGVAAAPAVAPETEVAEVVVPAPRAGVRAPERHETATEDPAAPLAAEVAFVDRGRMAFQAGDHRRALAELRRYEEEFPGQRLQAEVLYLRMEATNALGDTASAQALAGRILSAYPKSPHAARARAVVGSAP